MLEYGTQAVQHDRLCRVFQMSWTTIGDDSTHVARKAHRCTWCGQAILRPGVEK